MCVRENPKKQKNSKYSEKLSSSLNIFNKENIEKEISKDNDIKTSIIKNSNNESEETIKEEIEEFNIINKTNSHNNEILFNSYISDNSHSNNYLNNINQDLILTDQEKLFSEQILSSSNLMLKNIFLLAIFFQCYLSAKMNFLFFVNFYFFFFFFYFTRNVLQFRKDIDLMFKFF